ncbi:hypothetical protein BGZ68_008239 [Mortierella alpina]|nr:hypothetical protein BGZ68_008239 [Mortierella alpina]
MSSQTPKATRDARGHGPDSSPSVNDLGCFCLTYPEKSQNIPSFPSTQNINSQQPKLPNQQNDITLTQYLKQVNTPKAMSIFKRSNKIQSASVASTPSHTANASKQVEKPIQATKMTREEALAKIMQTSMGNATSGHYIH